MDVMLQKLQEYGADVDGAMGRFLNDVPLYKTCFTIFLEDEAFLKLAQALEERDYQNAFTYAHTIKGVAGNMGLTPLYQVICHIVEALRKNDYSCLSDYQAEMMEQLDKLEKVLA
ncbi:MAG: Hpt domain-containing protein [Clostridiales bacterium]